MSEKRLELKTASNLAKKGKYLMNKHIVSCVCVYVTKDNIEDVATCVFFSFQVSCHMIFLLRCLV